MNCLKVFNDYIKLITSDKNMYLCGLRNCRKAILLTILISVRISDRHALVGSVTVIITNSYLIQLFRIMSCLFDWLWRKINKGLLFDLESKFSSLNANIFRWFFDGIFLLHLLRQYWVTFCNCSKWLKLGLRYEK